MATIRLMIATDHAPHSAEEKAKGLKDSAFGVVGLETALPVVFTHLVKKKIISLEKMAELFSTSPRKRFGLPLNGDFSLWDLEKEFTVSPKDFLSAGKATPFEGDTLQGVCLATVRDGRILYQK